MGIFFKKIRQNCVRGMSGMRQGPRVRMGNQASLRDAVSYWLLRGLKSTATIVHQSTSPARRGAIKIKIKITITIGCAAGWIQGVTTVTTHRECLWSSGFGGRF